MALRVHEIHPSVVHFPLALVPTAIGLDAIGYFTNNEAMMRVARTLMPVAAASAAVAGAFGYVAQGAVNTDRHSHELLVTHRNINTALVVAVGLMTVVRSRRERPSLAYLLAGLGGTLAMAYTAYIGGKMVYSHRVGVEPDGVRIEESPEMVRGTLKSSADVSMRNAGRELRRSAREVRDGMIAPALRKGREPLTRPSSQQG